MKKIFVVYGDFDVFYSSPVSKPYELKEGEDLVEAIRDYAEDVHVDERDAVQELLEGGDINMRDGEYLAPNYDTVKETDFIGLGKSDKGGELFYLTKSLELRATYMFYVWDSDSGEPEPKIEE